MTTPDRPPDQRWQLGHRPALDGLRGVAILLVMADHSGIGFASGGGQLGVTIFFVLSGFLITTLLLEERARYGRVSLRRFYWRRALRLLPALIVLLAVVALLMGLAGRAGEIAGDVVPTLFYFMNWTTVAGNNPGLLSHTWSLSIEEQFYLVWPIAVLGLLAIGRGRLALVAAVLAGVSLLAVVLRIFVWSSPGGYYHAFLGTDARMDALAAGCLVALAFSWRPVKMPALLMVASAAALPLVLWSTNDESMAKVGLAVTVIAAVCLVAGAASSVGERLLGWRPLMYVGVISYGLYLWHRPVMRAFTDSGLGGVPWAVAVMLGLSFGLAVLSRHLVEEPFLRMKSLRFGPSAEDATDGSVSRAVAPPGRSARIRSRT